VTSFLVRAFAFLAALAWRADTKSPWFAISGPCHTVPTTGSRDPGQPQSGGTPKNTARFRGEQDWNGAPELVALLFADLPDQDIAGRHHFFVMLRACGHWVRDLVSMQPEEPNRLTETSRSAGSAR